MQKHALTILAFFVSWAVSAQLVAPRYVLVEHVTNSRCSVCASRNPAMYTLLSQHASQIHHLSYHPSFPYSTCIFYQENTVENNARANYYGVFGTPTVILNGEKVGPAGQLLPVAVLNPELNQTSPVYVQVTETATNVTVTVHTVGAKPEGTFALYVAFAEEVVNYNAPNGENVHHDVFRDMLSGIDGDAITLAETGGSVSFNFAKTSDSDWNTAQLYATAWVQNTTTKEVLNSGTKFDPLVSSVDDIAAEKVSFSPNPATDQIIASITNDTPQSVEVFALNGALVTADWNISGQQAIIDVKNLEAGIYFVQIRGEKQTFTGKFAKVE